MLAILQVIGNYLLIQGSIILFMLPFYLVYRHKHFPDHEPKTNLNQHLEFFFESKQANYLVFFWAFGEAIIWFIIPEFLLILLVFMRVRRKRELLMYDIYGTIAGTLVALVLPVSNSSLSNLPYVQPAMVTQVRLWYEHSSIWALLHQPFSGVPYKLFTHLASDYHFFIPAFLLLAVLVRISRYYIFYFILSSIYPPLHKYVYRNYVRLFLIATFIFSVLLLKVYNSYGVGYKATLNYPNQNLTTLAIRR